MASKKTLIKVQCSVCKRVNYYSRKSRKKLGKEEKKLEIKKFCKWCKKHTVHKEAKK